MNVLCRVVLILFLIAGGVSFFTYSFFWFEHAATIRSTEKSARGLRLKVLCGFLSSIASLPVLILTFPLGFVRLLWTPGDLSPSQPAIILVHGLYHNASAWLFFKYRLRKAGFTNIFVINYSSFFTSFESVVGKFESFVSDVRTAIPGQPIYLIGHSLGGLVSRVHAQRSGGLAPAEVITLGAPHQGSKVAAFAVGKLGVSLIYRGPLFAQLEQEPVNMPCPGVALLSPVDNLVIPSEGLKAPGPGWVHLQTSPISHVAMLYSPSTARKVIDLLQNGPHSGEK